MGGKQSRIDWAPVMAEMCESTGEDPGDKKIPKDYPRGAVSVGKKIVSGRFGAVSMCNLKDFDGSHGGLTLSGCCKKFKSVPKASQADIMRGVAQLAQISGTAHVVRMLGVVSSGDAPSLLLLEWCDGGNLVDFLRHSVGMGTAHKTKIIADVADGMSELEAAGIVHGNLCCKNVLVAESGTVFKVSDWGWQTTNARQLSHELLALATDKKPIKHTHASDAWAFALLAQQVFGDGAPAYPESWDDYQVTTKVSSGYVPKVLEACPKHIHEVMQKCWDHSPDNRPDFFWLRGEFEDKATAAQVRQQKLEDINRKNGTVTALDIANIDADLAAASN